jgi:ribonuclease HI
MILLQRLFLEKSRVALTLQGQRRQWPSRLSSSLAGAPSLSFMRRRRIPGSPISHGAAWNAIALESSSRWFSSSVSCVQELASRRLTAVFDDDPPGGYSNIIKGSSVRRSTQSSVNTNSPIIRDIDPSKTYALLVKGVTTRQSRGAGVGLVLYDLVTRTELLCSRIYVYGFRNSLEAEYTAIIMGMDYATSVLGVKRLLVESSYHAIIHQITGKYITSKPSINDLLEKVGSAQRKLEDCAFHYLPSTTAKQVDTLAHRALATRKSCNLVETADWQIHQRDPMAERSVPSPTHQSYNPPVFPPDPPAAQSIEIDPSRRYLLQFDGGARNDLGVGGAGMVIYDQSVASWEQEIWSGWYFHDEDATNNIAEYLALLYGLQCALSMNIRKLVAEGDSLLVVRQMNEEYLTREKSLMILRDAAREVANAFEDCEIRHIPRIRNRRADWLAGHAMDQCASFGFVDVDKHRDSFGWYTGRGTTNASTINNRMYPGSMACAKRFFSSKLSRRKKKKDAKKIVERRNLLQSCSRPWKHAYEVEHPMRNKTLKICFEDF